MKLSIIIPVLNEEKSLPELMQALDTTLASASDITAELVFVDDGSRDGTLAFLRELAKKDSRVRVISFSRNFGSHPALMAAFRYSSGDAVACLSADLQVPPDFLLQLVAKWREGCQVVWGARESRDDALLSVMFSIIYSSLMRRMALPDMPRTGVDVFLADRQVVEAVVNMREKNTSVVGQIMWSGFKQVFIPYHRVARRHGKSRWTFGKKLKLFVDSFVSFSFFPIRLVSYLGMIVSSLGFLYAIVVAIRWMFYQAPVQGWPSLMIAVVTLSGLQLVMLGVVAEYLWRTFDESRKRPPYIVKEFIGIEPKPGRIVE